MAKKKSMTVEEALQLILASEGDSPFRAMPAFIARRAGVRYGRAPGGANTPGLALALCEIGERPAERFRRAVTPGPGNRTGL